MRHWHRRLVWKRVSVLVRDAVLRHRINGVGMTTTPTVREWMTSPVLTIAPTTSVHTAHKLMTERRIRRLPVVQDGRLVGIVTLGDLRAAEPSGATTLSKAEILTLLDELPVAQIMARSVHTVSPGTSIREAAGMMLVHRVSGLPVVHQGEVVGMITESDIFRMLVRMLEPTLSA